MPGRRRSSGTRKVTKHAIGKNDPRESNRGGADVLTRCDVGAGGGGRTHTRCNPNGTLSSKSGREQEQLSSVKSSDHSYFQRCPETTENRVLVGLLPATILMVRRAGPAWPKDIEQEQLAREHQREVGANAWEAGSRASDRCPNHSDAHVRSPVPNLGHEILRW